MERELALLGGVPVRTERCPPWPVFDEQLGPELLDTLREGGFSELTGRRAREFGKAFADKLGVKYGIPVCNGTAAIHLALIALGIGPGDEVLVPTHTFIGSATPILMQNAIPIFVDVDEDTYTMDPEDLERKITDRSKAIIVVHLNGNPADMKSIVEVAQEHDLKIIEDCAQAHGAQYKGRYVGSIGDIGTFSFWQDKIITTAGEGGMVVTSIPEYAERIVFAKSHGEVEIKEGKERKYIHEFLGYNYRLTELQAIYGLHELKKLDEYVENRRRNAAYLTKYFSQMKNIHPPKEIDGGKHAFYKYVIKIDTQELEKDIEWIKSALQAEGIEVSRRYPLPLHLQPLFEQKKTYGNSSWPYTCMDREYQYGRGLCPVAEQLSTRLLTLLVHPTIDDKYLADVILAFQKIWSYIGA